MFGNESVKFSVRYYIIGEGEVGRGVAKYVGDEFPGLSDKSDRIFIDAKLAISSRVTIPELCISPPPLPPPARCHYQETVASKFVPSQPARTSFAVELTALLPSFDTSLVAPSLPLTSTIGFISK